jgi:hypothetical protein
MGIHGTGTIPAFLGAAVRDLNLVKIRTCPEQLGPPFDHCKYVFSVFGAGIEKPLQKEMILETIGGKGEPVKPVILGGNLRFDVETVYVALDDLEKQIPLEGFADRLRGQESRQFLDKGVFEYLGSETEWVSVGKGVLGKPFVVKVIQHAGQYRVQQGGIAPDMEYVPVADPLFGQYGQEVLLVPDGFDPDFERQGSVPDRYGDIEAGNGQNENARNAGNIPKGVEKQI